MDANVLLFLYKKQTIGYASDVSARNESLQWTPSCARKYAPSNVIGSHNATCNTSVYPVAIE